MTNIDSEETERIKEEVEKIINSTESKQILEVLGIDAAELRAKPLETMNKLMQRMIGFYAGIRVVFQSHLHRGK